MKINDKVIWDDKEYTIVHIEDRNTYEPLPGIKQIGDAIILQDIEGNKIQLYDFDL